MPEVVTLTTLFIDPAHEGRLIALTTETKQRFDQLSGTLSYAFWRDPHRSGTYLLSVHYDSVEASLRGYEAWGTSPQMFEVYEVLLASPDVHRLVVNHRSGLALGEVPAGSVLSVSRRIADTGLGSELAEELARIFAELTIMPGYLGSLIGHREQLAEEVSGLALWASEGDFAASVPAKTMYEVRPYVRVL